MPATVGRILHYTLTARDAAAINKRRSDAKKARKGVEDGAQIHFGNPAASGQVLPLIVTRTNGDGSVNGQVFLDGNDTLWVTSISEVKDELTYGTAETAGTWAFPPRV
jgi:hypothetical protein